MSKQTTNISDLAKVNAIALMQNMLEMTKTHRTELEEIGDNAYKQLLQNAKNQIRAIANTAGNSTANDLFIDALNAYDDELYDEFPNVEDLIILISNCMKLFRIAHGKSSQGEVQLYYTALLKSFSEVSMQQNPQYFYFDPHRDGKDKKKERNPL
jgi:hypothetical protein